MFFSENSDPNGKHIAPALLFGTLLFVLLAFPNVSGHYLASVVSPLTNFASASINLPTEFFSAGDLHTVSGLTFTLRGLKPEDRIEGVRFLVRNIVTNETLERNPGRGYKEEKAPDGTRLISLDHVTVPLNVPDGKYQAYAVIIVDNGKLKSAVFANQSLNIDYTAPTAKIQNGAIIVEDATSGIREASLYEASKSTGVIKKTEDVSLVLNPNGNRNHRTYTVVIPATRQTQSNFLIYGEDAAGNGITISFDPKKTADNILSAAAQRQEQLAPKPITSSPGGAAGQGGGGYNSNAQCTINLDIIYYDVSQQSFGDWWGLTNKANILRQAYYGTEGPNGEVYIYGIPTMIGNVVRSPDWPHNWENGGAFKPPVFTGGAVAFTGQNAGLVPFTQAIGTIHDDALGLDWNDQGVFHRLKNLYKTTPDRLPVIVVDRILNTPGPNPIGAVTSVREGVIVVDYVISARGIQGVMAQPLPGSGGQPLGLTFLFEKAQPSSITNTIDHELGHALMLGHTRLTPEYERNVMYPENTWGTTLTSSQAAALMSHTQNCSETYAPAEAGVYWPPQGGSFNGNYGGCGSGFKDRALSGFRPNDPDIEECENTFADPFNPNDATTIELGGDGNNSPLSYCPYIVPDTALGKKVIGVTAQTQHALEIQYGPAKYCVPPPYADQCLCKTANQLPPELKNKIPPIIITPSPGPTPPPPGPPTPQGCRVIDDDGNLSNGFSCGGWCPFPLVCTPLGAGQTGTRPCNCEPLPPPPPPPNPPPPPPVPPPVPPPPPPPPPPPITCGPIDDTSEPSGLLCGGTCPPNQACLFFIASGCRCASAGPGGATVGGAGGN